MSDSLRECNSGDLKTDPKSFQEVWCAHCQTPTCDLAGYAKNDPMARRQATWRERYFGMPEADLAVPKYAQISKLDFKNLFQKAMRLEVSERRGDWSVPEIPVLDGLTQSTTREVTESVDAATRRLAEAAGRWVPPKDMPVDNDGAYGEEDEAEYGEEEDEEEDEDEEEVADDMEPEPLHEPVRPPLPFVPVLPRPSERNTPDPGDVMIGGGPVPVVSPRARPAQEQDPWAPAPKPAVTVVKSGARIQFGPGGKAKVIDEG